MPQDQPHLPLSSYLFRFAAEEDLPLREDPRGLWHGVFGRALRQLACAVPGQACDGCLLLNECRYSYLFSGPTPPDAELMRRYRTIPVPHCFQLDPDPPGTVGAGGELRVSIVLVGGANESLPLVIRCMALAGESGLGSARIRV